MQKVAVLQWSSNVDDAGDIVRRMSSAGSFDGGMSEELIQKAVLKSIHTPQVPSSSNFTHASCGRTAPLQPHCGQFGDDVLHAESNEGNLCESVHCTPGYERFKDKSLTQWYEDESSVTTVGDHDSSSEHCNSEHSMALNGVATARTEVFFLYDISRAQSGLSC